MKKNESFEIHFDPISDGLAAIRNGECIVVVDDERRENEGDLICAAQFASPKQINFMATEARGLICLAMQGDRLDQLDLPLMVDQNTDENQTAFTISIDAGPEFGVSTGISAEDRSKTIQIVLNTDTKPNDLRRPGHIFPLRAKQGGVLKRAGHTEAAVDLAQLSGLFPAGVICEIQNKDGSMSRLPELKEYASNWGLKIISIADLIRYRLENQRFVHRQASANLPSIFGGFTAIGYKNEIDGSEHVALVKGEPGSLKEPVLVRMHSECLTGDAFGSLRCDCRPQLEAALARIELEGEGVVVYLRQEGRGIGLINKLRAYSLQEGGLDTVEANEKLGFPADLRNYGVGAQILTDLGIHKLKLLTNNPRKIAGLGGYGLKVEKREPLVICPGEHNAAYLSIKKEKMGHIMTDTERDYIRQNQSFLAVFWDGDVSLTNLRNIQYKAQELANISNIKLISETSIRLLALIDKPIFLWRLFSLSNTQESINNKVEDLDSDLLAFLKSLTSLPNTNKIGLLQTKNLEQALHPSLYLTQTDKTINDLIQENYKCFEKSFKPEDKYFIVWSNKVN